MRRVLTFLSDFGSSSPYPAAMTAMAAAITEARFLHITHGIRPHDVMEGAFVLWSVAPHCPEGTVHCAVVDPGVGTGRRGLVVEAAGQQFVGPDNGLLIPAAEALGIQAVYGIENATYMNDKVSTTFHGRDVFAPVAAHLASGIPPEKIGSPLSSWVASEIAFRGGTLEEDEGGFRGQIVYIDPFGNAVSNIGAELVGERASFDDELTLQIGSMSRSLKLRTSFGYAEPGELCLILGSHGLLELSVRDGSAREALGAHVGDEVRIRL